MKILYVLCNNDYDALNFEQNYKPTLELWDRVKKGEILKYKEEREELVLNVKAIEFKKVDTKFLGFVRSEIMDYGNSKHSNFYICEKKEEEL